MTQPSNVKQKRDIPNDAKSEISVKETKLRDKYKTNENYRESKKMQNLLKYKSDKSYRDKKIGRIMMNTRVIRATKKKQSRGL